MPLVRLFIQKTLQKPVPLAALQTKLCKVWGTTPQTTKLILTSVDAWTSEEFGEDLMPRYLQFVKGAQSICHFGV